MALALAVLCIVGTFGFDLGYADSNQPILGVVADDEVQVVKTNIRTEYKLSIKNVSSNAAADVRITIKGEHPFRSDIANLSKRATYINPSVTQTFTFDVTPSPTAESKIYDFDVLIEYKNLNGEFYSETQKAYVQVVNELIEPILGVYSAKTGLEELVQGTQDSLVMYIKNDGSIPAKNVRVTLSGFSNKGVILYKDVDTKSLDVVAAKENKMMFFNVIPGNDAEKGSFPLQVTIAYTDDIGTAYKKETVAYVQLAGKESINAEIKMSDVKFPTTITPNQDFEVTATVENTGDSEITSADITYEYPEFFVAKSASRVILKNLVKGEKRTVTFNMMAKADAPTESYHTYIKATFVPKTSTTTEPITVQEYVGLYVQNNDAADAKSKPKLIIEDYEYGGEHVFAGEVYPLTISIKNTSTSESTKNIKVTLTSEENVFTPVDSSSSFFIKGIGPGEVYTETIQLKTKIDANVKIYTITSKMQYEDGKGNAYDANKIPYEETEVLSVAVAQPVRLETADIVVPYEIYVGQPFYIEQEFYNMGKSMMYNMMVKLEGVETTEGSYFVGNFEAGKSDYFSAQATAYEIGTSEGKLVFSFEDALGNVSTKEQPFTLNVMDMPNYEENPGGFPMEPEIPMEEENGVELWKILLGGALVLIVVGFITRKVLIAKKHKRELEDLDE